MNELFCGTWKQVCHTDVHIAGGIFSTWYSHCIYHNALYVALWKCKNFQSPLLLLRGFLFPLKWCLLAWKMFYMNTENEFGVCKCVNMLWTLWKNLFVFSPYICTFCSYWYFYFQVQYPNSPFSKLLPLYILYILHHILTCWTCVFSTNTCMCLNKFQ